MNCFLGDWCMFYFGPYISTTGGCHTRGGSMGSIYNPLEEFPV